MEEFLGLAANRASQDIEYVHCLRVATRRAMAVIEFCREFFSQKRVDRLLDSLRRIRKAAGAARDMDVFLENHKNEATKPDDGVTDLVTDLRGKVQKPIRKIAFRYRRNNRLRKDMLGLMRTLRTKEIPIRRKPFFRWIKNRFRIALADFLDSEPNRLDDLRQLHHYRVRCKEMRYTLELLGDFADPQIQRKTIRHLVKLQDQLGKINDLSVACTRLEQWQKKCGKKDARILAKQLKSERKRLNTEVERLSENWTLRPLTRMESRLKDYLKQFPASSPGFK